jgi:hypothetical protein
VTVTFSADDFGSYPPYVPQGAADADPANTNPTEPVINNKAVVVIRMIVLLQECCPIGKSFGQQGGWAL